MLGNSLLFITSIINLKRFRHAFYYFVVIVVAETYFSEQVKNFIPFQLLRLQIFSVPYETDSLFFALSIIPLCDFFFKAYSSETIEKFLILLIPLLAQPFHISTSFAFAVGFIFWTITRILNHQNLIKMTKFRK